jgi:hypothetical protein
VLHEPNTRGAIGDDGKLTTAIRSGVERMETAHGSGLQAAMICRRRRDKVSKLKQEKEEEKVR